MGMQVPYCVDPEMQEETALWPTPEKSGRGVALSGPAKGEPGTGRTPATRPCAYTALHAAQVYGVPGGGVYERQKCDSYRADLPWSAEELWRHELLGAGLFCFNCGCR